MTNQENQRDKDRFEKLKETQVERGRDESDAIDVAGVKSKRCVGAKADRKTMMLPKEQRLAATNQIEPQPTSAIIAFAWNTWPQQRT